MPFFELNFYPKPETRGDEYGQFDDLVGSFLIWLKKNGNLISDWQILELEECVQARVLAPERIALNEEFFCDYAREDLAKIRAMSTRSPEFVCIKEKPQKETCCVCQQPSGYVLFTNFLDMEMPVACMDCHSAVPLYRLPHIFNERSHDCLLNWQSTYAALDTLYMYSHVGERFGYRQLASPHSAFMRRTRELAKELEETAGKPVYWFLLHAYKRFGDDCPLCKRLWRLEEAQGIFAFKCDLCRIVSTDAYSEAIDWSELHP